MPRAGIVTLAGRPNAGKSTLLNRLVGEPLSITSPKPQSTRNRIVGIRTQGTDPTAADAAQMVFFDTPGLLEPKDALQHSMRAGAREALEDADVIVYLVDATEGSVVALPEAADLARPPRAPILTALNKIDLVPRARRTELLAVAPDLFAISATTGEGVDQLFDRITALLPESPFLYPADDISTQPLRFFAAELVRETALEQLEQEVPHSLAVLVDEFREERTPLYIRAVLYVERESQKGIILGHKGARIRELGRTARVKIERLVGRPVYLDLWVKVLANWRRDPDLLKRLGYDPAGRETRAT
jgi:GTP-binding protein Era